MNLPWDVSEIRKSAVFEMSLRRCMRRLKDASEMHPRRLGFIRRSQLFTGATYSGLQVAVLYATTLLTEKETPAHVFPYEF